MNGANPGGRRRDVQSLSEALGRTATAQFWRDAPLLTAGQPTSRWSSLAGKQGAGRQMLIMKDSPGRSPPKPTGAFWSLKWPLTRHDYARRMRRS